MYVCRVTEDKVTAGRFRVLAFVAEDVGISVSMIYVMTVVITAAIRTTTKLLL